MAHKLTPFIFHFWSYTDHARGLETTDLGEALHDSDSFRFVSSPSVLNYGLRVAGWIGL